MSVERALYKCDGCSLELTMIAPVNRPCPKCGGTFQKQHPLDYEIPRGEQDRIDAIVAEVFPELLADIEKMLAAVADSQANDNGE